MSDDGQLTEVESKVSKIATINSDSFLCITTTVESKSIKTSEFVLAWHMPEVKFGLEQRLLDVSEDTTLPEHVRKWVRFGYLEVHEY